MYLLGHVGVTLLVYAPLSYRLVRVGRGRRAAMGAATLLLLVNAPDLDSWVTFFSHRGLTHTIWAAFAVGAATGVAWWLLSPQRGPERDETTAFGFVVGALSVVNHLAADALNPIGVRPLYPLADVRIALDLVAAAAPAANFALAIAGVAALLASVGLGRRHQWTVVDEAGSHSTAAGPGEPRTVPVRDGRHVRRADGGLAPGEEREASERRGGEGGEKRSDPRGREPSE